MILTNHPLTGALFLPTVGLAVCIFIAGYYLSKNSDSKDEARRDTSEKGNAQEAISTKTTYTSRKKTEKKHKCGCGSGDTQDTTPPSKINIFYGTTTGKSKVLKIF